VVPDHVRPLRISEIVDGGFALARRTMLRCIPVTLVFILPIEIAVWWGQHSILEAQGTTDQLRFGSFRFADASSLLVGFLQLTGLAVAVAVCCSITVDAFVGTMPANWRQSTARAGRRLFGIALVLFVGAFVMLPIGVLLGSILGGIGVLLVFMAYVAGGLAVAIWFCLALGPLAFMTALYVNTLPAMFAEGISAGRAIGRGFQLGGRRLFANTAAILLLFGIAVIAWLSLQLILVIALQNRNIGSELVDTGVSVIIGTAITVFIAPAFAGLFTTMYFDARVRREGLDLLWALRDEVPA